MQMTIIPSQHMVLIGAFCLPFFVSVLWDKTPGIAVMARKRTAWGRAAVGVRAVQNIAVEENHVSRFGRTCDLRVSIGDSSQLVDVRIIFGRGIIIKDIFQRARFVSQFVLNLWIQRFDLRANAEPQAAILFCCLRWPPTQRSGCWAM